MWVIPQGCPVLVACKSTVSTESKNFLFCGLTLRSCTDDNLRLLLREAVSIRKQLLTFQGNVLPLSSTCKKSLFTDSLDAEDHSRKLLRNVGRDVRSHKTNILFTLHYILPAHSSYVCKAPVLGSFIQRGFEAKVKL